MNSDAVPNAPHADSAVLDELAKEAAAYKDPVVELGQTMAKRMSAIYASPLTETMAKQMSAMYTTPLTETMAKQVAAYKNPVAELGQTMAKQMSAIYASPLTETMAKQMSAITSPLTETMAKQMSAITSPLTEMLVKQVAAYKNPLAELGEMTKISSLGSDWLAGYERGGPADLMASFRDDLTLDPVLIKEIDELFGNIGAPEALIDETAETLGLILPFGYDPAIRAGLQAIAVSSLFAILLMAFIYNPFLGFFLSAAGTPNSVATWKATGKAYDRLYGVEAKSNATRGKARKGGPLTPKKPRRRSSRW